MENFNVNFTSIWPTWLLIFIPLILLASALIFYVKISKQLSKRVLTLLLSLRVLALLLLTFSFLRPTFSFNKINLDKQDMLVLVDTSGSMSIQDTENLGSRLERTKSVLEPLSGWLSDSFNLSWYSFDKSLQKMKNVKDAANLESTGEATAVSKAILDAINDHKKANLAGVVVLSDGEDNASEAFKEDVLKYEVPIYPIGVGSHLREQGNFHDTSLTQVDVGSDGYVTVNNIAQIDCYVDAIGMPDRVLTVNLKDNADNKIADNVVTLDNIAGPQKVTLEYTPKELGKFDYTVSFVDAEIQDDAIAENNFQQISVNVVNPKIKILYLEGTLRAEYKFLLRTLQKDPNVQLLSLVRIRENQFTKQGNIKDIDLAGFPETLEELKQFNVIIFGDIDYNYFARRVDHLENLKTAVSEGAGFLMIGGYHSFGPGGYGATAIEDILPVRLGTRQTNQSKTPFVMAITPQGIDHPIFSGIADFFTTDTASTSSKLPELLGCVRVVGTKPAAEVLTYNPLETMEGSSDPLPVLAVQQYGKGRTAALTVDTTWKWYLQMRGLGRQSPYVRFWGQLVRWLSGAEVKRSEEPGIDAYVDKGFLQPGEKVTLQATARAEEGLATKFAQVQATIKQPELTEKTVTLSYEAGTSGDYAASFTPPFPGKYTVDVVATLKGTQLGKQQLDFRVGKPNLEFDKLDINETFMSELANRSGGAYFPLPNVNQLSLHLQKQLLAQQKAENPDYTEVSVWDNPGLMGLFFILFVGVISLEWILRKSYQLA